MLEKYVIEYQQVFLLEKALKNIGTINGKKLKRPIDLFDSEIINKRLRFYEDEIDRSVTNLIENNKLSEFNCTKCIKSIVKV